LSQFNEDRTPQQLVRHPWRNGVGF
jgi:hypothetical protein